MLIQEIFGKRITDIYAVFTIVDESEETAECFLELDKELLIGVPFDFEKEVQIRKPNPEAKSLFTDLADYPVYDVNESGKTIGEIASAYQKRKTGLLNKIWKLLFRKELMVPEYQPYNVTYKENRLKHVKDATIIDFIWYENEETSKGFFLLHNGYVITETNMSPVGTGMAGLNYFESLAEMTASNGAHYKRLMQEEKSNG
jgi:hypothetical protein